MSQSVTLDALAPDPVVGDAFGAMLRAVHTGSGGVGAIERDDGRIEPHDALQYFTGPPEWPALDRQACASATGTVLDIGCGAGRHLLSLQQHGRHAIGIDVSAGACEVARERGATDVRYLGLDDVAELGITVDTILMLGNNLALLGSVEAAARRLTALAAVATRRTRVLGTNLDPYGDGAPVPAEHARYHAANRARGRLGGQLRLRARFGQLADPWFDYLLCSQAELLDLLADSPWRLAVFAPAADGPGYLAELRLR
jgi:SAM-dependent methyltransferase